MESLVSRPLLRGNPSSHARTGRNLPALDRLVYAEPPASTQPWHSLGSHLSDIIGKVERASIHCAWFFQDQGRQIPS